MSGQMYDRALDGEPCWVRLDSTRAIGPWFRWASVGIDSVSSLAAEVGLAIAGVHRIGGRVVASLAAA